MGNERWSRRQFVSRAGKTAGGVVLGLSFADFLAACGTSTSGTSGSGKLEIFSWWTGPGEKDGLAELTGAGRSTTDYWVRYSLSAMIFAGVFDRYPLLKVGSVEHEAAWIPHWLKQMDFTYVERPVFTKGWKSAEGLMPSDYWKRNMFVEFMEDDLGVQLRDRIGVENMLWGSDYPHAEATFPRSQQFLGRMFAGVPEADLRKITSDNAAKMFGFTLFFLALAAFFFFVYGRLKPPQLEAARPT